MWPPGAIPQSFCAEDIEHLLGPFGIAPAGAVQRDRVFTGLQHGLGDGPFLGYGHRASPSASAGS